MLLDLEEVPPPHPWIEPIGKTSAAADTVRMELHDQANCKKTFFSQPLFESHKRLHILLAMRLLLRLFRFILGKASVELQVEISSLRSIFEVQLQ